MKSVTHLIFIALTVLISLSGCSAPDSSSSRLKTILDHRPYEGRFLVFGRVLNEGNTGVDSCEVVLTKRQIHIGFKPTHDTKAVTPVAITNETGDYSFYFDPHGSNNLWIYFEAEGYTPQLFEIDSLFRGPLYRRPPNNPIKVDIVLEREEK